jgi:hypothetical protein
MKYSWGLWFFEKKCLQKAFSIAALMVLGSGVWAQRSPEGAMTFTDDPTSVVNDASYRYDTDIGNFMGVTDWSGVEYNNWFFFLGGKTGPRSGNNGAGVGLQGGLATKIGSNHLGIYFNGNFFEGSGSNNGANDTAMKNISGQHYWNDSLSILFGNEAIGGIRFNLLFQEASFSSIEQGNNIIGANMTSFPNGFATDRGSVTTSLQWGKSFGDFTPTVTIGFRWPDKFEYEQTGTGVFEAWDHAQLGVKLEASYKDFSLDYQLSVDLGPSAEYTQTSIRNGTVSGSGYIDNLINLKYSFTADVGEKLQFKLRPQLQFGFYNTSNEYTIEDSVTGKTQLNRQPEGYFWFDPIVQLGARYAFSPKVNIYTGVQAKFLGLTRKYTSTYKPSDTADEVKDTPSTWVVQGIRFKTGGFALQINPTDNLSIEIGMDGLVSFESGSWSLNFSNLGGGLAVIIKP